MIIGLKHPSPEEMPRKLGLSSSEKAFGTLQCSLPVLEKSLQGGGGPIFTWSHSKRAKGNGFKREDLG